MRIRTALLACVLILPTTASLAAEQYKCILIADDGKGANTLDASQYVDLSIDKDVVRSVIHIMDASKDLTFSTCKTLPADGSNFNRWFKIECRDLKSVDGKSYTIEPFLAGAYAGISPIIDKNYSMYGAIAAVGTTLNIGTPARTFAIYADKKPAHEFFCYSEKPKP